MNDVIEMPRRESAGLVAGEVHRFSAGEIRERVNLVQSVMQGIMKRDTHYGTIPGTPKPTLYKPGAEVLCVTFRIAQEYQIIDLGDQLTARFRVTCVGRHQVTGIVLGEGVGECSSAEEKYKWRKAVCTEEFELMPESMRRLKFSSYQGNVKKAIQVRTEAADLSNTVLKMACKRAMIAMTLNVTAASDIFTQDIEDLPEELRTHEAGEPAQAQQQATLPEPPAELLAAAQAAAKAGVAAYQQFFAGAGVPSRKALAAHHEALKATAEAADRQRAASSAGAEQATKPAIAPVSDEIAGMAADLLALAEEDSALFADAWARLSKATQDQLSAASADLKKHIEAIEVAK